MDSDQKGAIAFLSIIGALLIFFTGIFMGNAHVKRFAVANNCAHLVTNPNKFLGTQFVWGPIKD